LAPLCLGLAVHEHRQQRCGYAFARLCVLTDPDGSATRRPVTQHTENSVFLSITFGFDLSDTAAVMKMLIVDDNPAMRRLIKRIIHDLAEVIECKDGSEAVALYERHRPDWVSMDIRMKQLGGIEATRQIIASHPDARVVIVTEYDDPRLRVSAREAGACRYLTKDDVSSLREIISKEFGE
jgi:CheY-like chemotaxis protein